MTSPLDSNQPTFSVSVRLQRITSEECHVSVPVTDDVMQDEPHADGTFRLDGKKVFETAIRMGQESAAWTVETQQVAIHQIQKAPEHIQQQLDQQ